MSVQQASASCQSDHGHLTGLIGTTVPKTPLAAASQSTHSATGNCQSATAMQLSHWQLLFPFSESVRHSATQPLAAASQPVED